MRNTICPWLNVHYLGMNVRVYRFMFILHYICQDSICRIKREYTRSPSQKKTRQIFFTSMTENEKLKLLYSTSNVHTHHSS